MIRKLNSDDFAKLMMFVAIFIAGLTLGAATNGWSNLQSWISALSGWFAGGAAIWIGVTQLRPIIEDHTDRRRSKLEERTLRLLEKSRELRKCRYSANGIFSTYMTEKPAKTIFLGTEGSISERIAGLNDFFNEVDEIVENIDFVRASFVFQPNTRQEFRLADLELMGAINSFRDEIGKTERKVVNFCSDKTTVKTSQIEAFMNDLDTNNEFDGIRRETNALRDKVEKYHFALKLEILHTEVMIQTNLRERGHI